MKKKLTITIMALLCLLCNQWLAAQTYCNGHTTNTDWRNYAAPTNPPTIPVPPYQNINNFDWSANFFTIYEDVGGIVTAKQLQSPFWENTSGLATEPNVDHFRNKFYNNGFYTNPTQAIASVDIWPEDGWELLYKDFGNPTTAYSSNPSFGLYNRFTGVMRIFYYVEQLGNTASSTARVSILRSDGFKNNALLSFSQTELNALDGFEEHLATTLNYAQALDDFWIFVEMPMAFDPCVCRYPTEEQLDIKFQIIENATMVLQGTASGFSNPTVYNNGTFTPYKSNKISNPLKKKGTTDLLKEVNGYYKTLSSFKDNVNTMIGNQDDKKGDKAKATSEISTLFDVWKTSAKQIPKLGAVIGIIDFLVTGGKGLNSETKEPTPIGYETELNIELSGDITEDINLSTLGLRVPGASNTGSPNPIYNNPLGVFNLLETPKIEYAEYSTSNTSGVIERYQDPQGNVFHYVQHFNRSSAFSDIKLREYQLVPSSTYNRLINYIINPNSQLTAKQIKAAILFKFSNLPDYIDTSNYINYFAGPVEFGITIPERDGLGFVHRMRMLGYEIESWPDGSSLLKDITFRTNYADLACLEEEASFYCWDNTNVSGTYTPETWLKLDIQLQRNDDYAVSHSADVQDVMMILKYVANESVQNTTVSNLQYSANMVIGVGRNPSNMSHRLDYEILPNGDFQPNSLSWSVNASDPWNGTWGITKQQNLTPGPWQSPINKKYGTLIINNSNKHFFTAPYTPRIINAYNLYIHPTVAGFTTHHNINIGNQVYYSLNWNTINNNVNWQQNIFVAYIANPGSVIPYFGSTFEPIASEDPALIADYLSFIDLNYPNLTFSAAEMLPFVTGFVTNISPEGTILLNDNNNTGLIYIHGYKFCNNSVQNFQATQSDVNSFCSSNTYASLSLAKTDKTFDNNNSSFTEVLEEEKLKVYPNPNDGAFTVTYNVNGSKKVSLFITDLSGKNIATIVNNKVYSTGSFKQNIALENLKSGVYICNIIIGEKALKEKIVIIK